MFVKAYIDASVAILNGYDGAVPFASYLKKYFSVHKKFGSRDRRHIAQLCYSFFRLGKALPHIPTEEKLFIALLLCQPNHPVVAQLKPEWKDIAAADLTNRLHWVNTHYAFTIADIFPYKKDISGDMDYEPFCTSFLIQPLLYLRVRPGYEKQVAEKLTVANISFQALSKNTIALPNTTKADDIVVIDTEAVVQDMSSQQVLNMLKEREYTANVHTVWDCCAASGGKSILLHDILPHIKLTVSDIRKSILLNLQQRFKRTGMADYKWFVADIASDSFRSQQRFDLIICDAPCSGSGTWSRTPEQLYFFDENKITYYADLQKKIVRNAAKCLTKNGFFLYITCSVFQQENEAMVQYIRQQLSLPLVQMQYYKGYDAKADTLFAALFQL
jgi:16S rRNA (cytosine967-C5)-methyltransferase